MPWTKVTEDSILCEVKMSSEHADKVSTLLQIEITQYVELALYVYLWLGIIIVSSDHLIAINHRQLVHKV